MACMLLLAACDNYLDIQPTGSVIPNSLAEYRALLARSYMPGICTIYLVKRLSRRLNMGNIVTSAR